MFDNSISMTEKFYARMGMESSSNNKRTSAMVIRVLPRPMASAFKLFESVFLLDRNKAEHTY